MNRWRWKWKYGSLTKSIRSRDCVILLLSHNQLNFFLVWIVLFHFSLGILRLYFQLLLLNVLLAVFPHLNWLFFKMVVVSTCIKIQSVGVISLKMLQTPIMFPLQYEFCKKKMFICSHTSAFEVCKKELTSFKTWKFYNKFDFVLYLNYNL